MRRAALLLAGLPLAGCAYFNGIYNARQAEQKGDALLRAGRSADAGSLYTVAATKAESVLAHHPGSRWTGDALLIAGWSWAMAAQCDRAEPRLSAFLIRSPEEEPRLARATLALAVCRVRQGRYAEGRALLAPLTKFPDRRVAGDAALWAALASVSLGEPDSARAYLRGAHDARNEARAEWALARAFLDRGDVTAAESLLVRRAADGDFRPDLLEALRTLWEAGRAPAVSRIVTRYDASRAPAEDRAHLHLLAGELALASDRDSLARVHLAAAQRLSRDSAVVREAHARLTLAELRGVSSLVDVETIIARGREGAAGTPLQRRLDNNLLLLRMLYDHDDYTGASLFLAAEVARDSLRALALARTLFTEVTTLPGSPLAAKALLAARQLEPDSAAASRARADTVVAGAAFGSLADPHEPATAPTFDPEALLLQRTWATVTARYADSLRHLHPTSDSASAVTSTVKTIPGLPPRPTPAPPAGAPGRPSAPPESTSRDSLP